MMTLSGDSHFTHLVEQARQTNKDLVALVGTDWIKIREDGQDYDFDLLSRKVSNFDLADQRRLAKALFQLIDIYKQISIPSGYLDFIHEVHKVAWADFIKKPGIQKTMFLWREHAPDFINMKTGEVALDPETGRARWLERGKRLVNEAGLARLKSCGLTFERNLSFMQEAAESMHYARNHVLRSDIGPYQMRVASFDQDRFPDRLQFSVQRDPSDNRNYYEVGTRSHVQLDIRSLTHVGFHEPQHNIESLFQGAYAYEDHFSAHIPATVRPSWDDHIVERYRVPIRQMNELLKISSVCPSGMLDNTRDLDLSEAVYVEYQTRPKEVTAFVQGFCMELSMCRHLGLPVSPRTRTQIESYPFFAEALAPDIKSWYQAQKPVKPSRPVRFYPPSRKWNVGFVNGD